jgi:type VII secretion ATPase EccA
VAQKRIFSTPRFAISAANLSTAAKIAWYLAMTRRALGNEAGAVALLEWLQASYASPKAAEALRNPGLRLVTTTAESIESRTDVWDPGSTVADDVGREALLAEAQSELDRQIGLHRVKEQVDRYRAATQMAKVRGARGMKVGQSSRHMIFTGPPGTGKTTIARIVANILAGLGVIAEPKLVETSRKDFVAEYEGQSAVKTTKTIDRALGGVLFIDEAYTLVQERDGRADPFGTEALDTLLARMENDRDQLVVIIAGYSNDIDRLLEANDGLRSRFANRIEFESYAPEEIAQIAEVIAAKNDSRLDNDAVQQAVKAATMLSGQRLSNKPALDIAGNGRYARQLVEAAEECRDLRLSRSPNLEKLATEELSVVTGDDMAAAVAAVHARLGVGE